MSKVSVAWAMPLGVALILSGCGTYVPEIQEFPANALSGQQLVDLIVFNVKCEVQDAIIEIYKQPPYSTFMDTWGAQITLNLQVEEKGSANPTANWIPWSPLSSVFNLTAGVTGSADATRIDKINWFMAVADARRSAPCGEMRPNGLFILQGDLKLKEWLYDAITAGNTKLIDYSGDTATGPFKQSVLSHEVKFEIITGGNVIPGWKLSRLTINQSGTGLTASRDRTQDLTLTFGPAVATTLVATDASGKAKKDANGNVMKVTTYGPSDLVVSSHLASEIGLAVANGIKSALPSP
jgi:hypothetical protein